MGKGWKSKLPDAVWAYQMAYKTPIVMSPFQTVYGEACHLPVELEHRAYWAIKNWNMDFKVAGRNRQKQIAELDEWREKAYHSAKIYKERTKKWHDHRIKPRSLEKATAFYSLTPRYDFSVQENFGVSGKDHTPSSRPPSMARSP